MQVIVMSANPKQELLVPGTTFWTETLSPDRPSDPTLEHGLLAYLVTFVIYPTSQTWRRTFSGRIENT
jgi:hypothetical protein